MGCGVSQEALAKYKALEQQIEQLKFENANLKDLLEKNEAGYKKKEQKSAEQLNLLRFKVEVLVHMLAVEEKKVEASTKRLEALKWAMLSQGITEKTMNNHIKGVAEEKEGEKSANFDNSTLMISAFDLSGAIQRLSEEIKQSKDILVHTFADSEGKIISALSREEFIRYLYAATDNLSKSDVQVLSLRFFDGSAVCIPEFIDFFTSTSGMRTAKAAASAVRASLNKLQLDTMMHGEQKSPPSISNYQLTELEYAIDLLKAMWTKNVERELLQRFDEIDSEVRGNQVFLVETFREILTEVCGEDGEIITATKQRTKNASEKKKIRGLSEFDIELISDRFELGGRVDVYQFIRFFNEMKDSGDSVRHFAVPYRYSTEWSTLKSTAQKEISSVQRFTDTEENSEPPSRPQSAREHSSTKPPVLKSSSNKELAYKPPSPKAKSESGEKTPKLSIDVPTSPVKEEKEPLSDPRPQKKVEKKAPQPTPKPILLPENSTILETYAKDPKKFHADLLEKSAKNGYLFTAPQLQSTLGALCPTARDPEIDTIVNGLLLPGGTCSAGEVTEVLRNLLLHNDRDEEKVAEPEEKKKESNKAKKELPSPVLYNPRLKEREQRLDQLKAQSVLDPITTRFKEKPKEFNSMLVNAATDDKKTSITLAALKNAINKEIPTADAACWESLNVDLNSKVRPTTNDLLLSTVTAVMKQRVNQHDKLLKMIAQEEKEKVKEEQKNARMAERHKKIEELKKTNVIDSLTNRHKDDAKFFATNLKTETEGGNGSELPEDKLKSALSKLVPTAKAGEVDGVVIDSLPKKNAKTNMIPISAVVNVLNTRLNVYNKNVKEIANLEKQQEKDANPSSGGICGGSSKNVHDPSKAPQELKPADPSTSVDALTKDQDDLPPIGDGNDDSKGKFVPKTLSFQKDTKNESGGTKLARHDTANSLAYSPDNSEKDSWDEDEGERNSRGARKQRDSRSNDPRIIKKKDFVNKRREADDLKPRHIMQSYDSDNSLRSEDASGLRRINSRTSDSMFSDVGSEDEPFTGMRK